jgi:hypothetical protein
MIYADFPFRFCDVALAIAKVNHATLPLDRVVLFGPAPGTVPAFFYAARVTAMPAALLRCPLRAALY